MTETATEVQARRSTRDVVTEWAFGTGWQVVKWLPEPAAYRMFDLAADMLWRRRGGGVVQFERNQARVHPELTPQELSEMSRRGMRSYLRYWCDSFRLPTWSTEKIRTFSLERVDLLDEAMAAGNGVIIALNHGGNWDSAGAWACERYGALTTVAERLKPEGLFDKFVAFRESLGMEIVPLGDPNLMRTLARRLKEGRLVPLLGDRDISRNGVEVDFFGEVASLPAGPAVLAMLTGATLLPITLWYSPEASTGYIHDAIHVPAQGDRTEKIRIMTQQIASSFEAGLRDHSVDWHMMQPVWIADLDARRRGTSEASPGVDGPDDTPARRR